jgi:uncharacterized protein YkwD
MSRPASSARLVLVSAVAVLLATVAALTTVGAQAATPYDASSYGARLLDLVNMARAQHGLRPLVLASGTTAVAAGWTQHLADSKSLSHNGQLGRQLSSHGSRAWRVYGENVGVGSATDPDGLFAAYWKSPEHRANILNGDYRYVGVAVVLTGSRAWNTFDFVDVYGQAQPLHHAGRRHVQRSAHAVLSAPKVAQRPVVVTPAKPAHPIAVHVEGLHHSAQIRPVIRHPFTAMAAAATPTAALGPVALDRQTSRGGRTQPVALALAVLALMFVARRWMLAAVCRNA